MKKFLSVSEAMKKGKGSVAVRGWVYRERKSNKFIFIILRDPSDIIQCVVEKDKVSEKVWKDANKLLIESSIEIEGDIKPDKRAPTGFEIKVKKLNVVHFAEVFPISKDKSTEFLLDKRHLWLRSRNMNAIFKVRHTIVTAIHKFFQGRGYYLFDPPILQPSQCEGGATLFEVNYYDDVTYLSQSWQLYAEAAIFSLGKVYDMAPTFRAERSKTSRHLSEFWMAEMEAAWMELDEITEVAKDEVRFIIKEVLKHNRKELELLGQNIKKLEKIAKKKWPTITYRQAIKILNEKEKVNIKFGKDLRTIEEDKIMKHFDTPIVVTHYPKAIMAFYKPRDPKDSETALCFDMLAPDGYGELIGGSQRDTNIDDLIESLKAMGEDPKNYEWYLDLRRFGSVPHSGYGLGVERLLAWICKLDNIKDAIAFPRTMLRKHP